MSLAQAQQFVANEFLETMREFEFETFEEMRDCYWWTSSDIKNEVDYMLKNTNWYIDDSGADVINQETEEIVSYRSFIAKVYKLIKEAKI